MVVWSLLFSAIMIATFLARPFIPQFLQDAYSLNQFQIGVFGSVTFLGSALLGIYLGRIGDKWSKASAISISVILCCISFVVLTLCNNFLTLTLASFLVGCSYATPMLMDAIVGSFAQRSQGDDGCLFHNPLVCSLRFSLHTLEGCFTVSHHTILSWLRSR